MTDKISMLVKKLLAAEDPTDVQSIGSELQDAIRSHIASIREKAAGPQSPIPQQPPPRKKNGGDGKKS